MTLEFIVPSWDKISSAELKRLLAQHHAELVVSQQAPPGLGVLMVIAKFASIRDGVAFLASVKGRVVFLSIPLVPHLNCRSRVVTLDITPDTAVRRGAELLAGRKLEPAS